MRRFLQSLLALSIGLLIGHGAGCKPPPVVLSQAVTVEISGTPSPVVVRPDTVEVLRQDTLMWYHPSADSFFIDMSVDRKGSPAVDKLLKGVGGSYAVTVIREDALVDSVYKYLVTVWQDGRMDSLDPHIIPREEEGPH
ncbi:MAG: hypothetical protein PVG79_04130 [Gemmatimonadales bacterium]|jgi:hypothetical protein